ncbi:hypothetical protein OEA41_003797 [Lepraria neglecta]|uniref:Uncharacterized protein n=1 Tax=Lepraria neglecta TaxID=209136 RepID=A0AAD9Z934_9LECA|nr:hypothetical protein OEA41_003797 [Lepraria neglecta]
MDFKRHNPADPVQDITDHHFWDVDFRFLTNEVSSNGLIFSCESAKKGDEPLSISDLAAQECRPNVWLSTDGLVKSFYSTIMTDLGQTAPGPNTLLNETALEFYTHNFTDMFTHIANAIPGPGIQSYADGKDQTGSLGTTSSVVFTKYLCQVPQQKSTGMLLVSILVADLVFIQMLWKVFNFITTAVLIRKKPKDLLCRITHLVSDVVSGRAYNSVVYVLRTTTARRGLVAILGVQTRKPSKIIRRMNIMGPCSALGAMAPTIFSKLDPQTTTSEMQSNLDTDPSARQSVLGAATAGIPRRRAMARRWGNPGLRL